MSKTLYVLRGVTSGHDDVTRVERFLELRLKTRDDRQTVMITNGITYNQNREHSLVSEQRYNLEWRKIKTIEEVKNPN